MSSFALCLKKAGKALSFYEKEQLRKSVSEGMTEQEAMQIALDGALKERDEILKQLPTSTKDESTPKGPAKEKGTPIPMKRGPS